MDAVSQLYAAHNDALLARALRYTNGNRQDAEDLVMLVWTDATRTFAAKAPDNPLNWLHMVLKRRAIDRSRRKQYRSAEMLAGVPEDVPRKREIRPGTHYAETTSPNDPAEITATRDRWRSCMAYLSPRSAEIVHLCFFEGFSVADAAAALGISQVAAKARVLRAKKQLGRCLTQVEDVVK